MFLFRWVTVGLNQNLFCEKSKAFFDISRVTNCRSIEMLGLFAISRCGEDCRRSSSLLRSLLNGTLVEDDSRKEHVQCALAQSNAYGSGQESGPDSERRTQCGVRFEKYCVMDQLLRWCR